MYYKPFSYQQTLTYLLLKTMMLCAFLSIAPSTQCKKLYCMVHLVKILIYDVYVYQPHLK